MLDKEKLNKIGLDYISLKVSRGRDTIYCIDSDINNAINDLEPDSKYIIDVYIDIIGIKQDSDEEINIGKLEGNYFEAEEAIDDYSFIEICECRGRDIESLATVITDSDGYRKESICEFDESLMYIDRIYIEKEYREAGIMSFVIESLQEILQYTLKLNPSVFILLPKPQEKDENGEICNVKDEYQKEICMKKLLKLYKKLGFKNIRNSNYMIKRKENRNFELEI